MTEKETARQAARQGGSDKERKGEDIKDRWEDRIGTKQAESEKLLSITVSQTAFSSNRSAT